ncbi:hypothetical protein FRC12_022064 [Ceratobasidium sp. 428]|nr:hypothetical protein FRC12_022064 [Ceratobasidium sp. 428]
MFDTSNDDCQQQRYLKYTARELHTWSKLHHPYVLKLLGLAEYLGQISMVSPWIEGGSLRRYLARKPKTNRPRLCMQIAEGLTYLHESGVVHGDLKGVSR